MATIQIMPRKRRKIIYGPNFNLRQLVSSILFLSKGDITQKLFLLALNFALFLRVGLQTMIPLLSLAELFILLSLISFTLARNIYPRNKTFIGFFLAPLAINLLLTINYLVSFNPAVEAHTFHHNYENVKGINTSETYQRSSLISLTNDQYKAYPGIRVFWDYSQVATASKIIYTFKTGLLGIRVMTGYHFI